VSADFAVLRSYKEVPFARIIPSLRAVEVENSFASVQVSAFRRDFAVRLLAPCADFIRREHPRHSQRGPTGHWISGISG
jgi:hypothetical protein